jgi:predicted dehydrogenase
MNNLSIIGFGDHVVKNIFPLLSVMRSVNIRSVHVRNPQKYKNIYKDLNFLPIEKEPEKGVDWIYVATPISTHYELASKYLKMGFSVICEKPITDKFHKTLALYKLAANLNLKIHEVCMYKNHKQYKKISSVIFNLSGDLKVVEAKFQIPHLKHDNIRYSRELGGGALLDVGYYPISFFQSLFGLPKSINAVIKSEPKYNVDTLGSALFEYENILGVAHWGIGKVYQNYVLLDCGRERFFSDRIFSKPKDFSTSFVRSNNGLEVEHEIGADDHFENQFENIFNNVVEHNKENALQIIEMIEKIRS